VTGVKLCCVEFTNKLGCLQEMKSVQHEVTAVQQQHDQLIEHMKGKQDELQQLQDTTRQLDTQLEERKLKRQKVWHSLKFTACIKNIIITSNCLRPCVIVMSLLVSEYEYVSLQQLTYLLIYLLTQWSRVLLEKLTSCMLVKKFPNFMEPEGS
jgi:hypothetical protein